MAFDTSGLATYSRGSPAATRDPVSTRMREIGPFTWVMAWVVWSASQSTVPVVRTEITQEVLRTGTMRRCGSWSWGTVNRAGSAVLATTDSKVAEVALESGYQSTSMF